jgi:predicted porin
MGLGTFSAGGIGVPINSGWISDFIPQPDGFTNAFRSPAMSTAIDIVNDDNVITYFSPRLAGFQFGASYAPRASFSGKPVGGPVNSNASFDSANDRYENGFAFGANWLGEFAGVNLGFSAGFAQAFANDAVEDIGGDDIQQVMVGGMVGFAGLSFDASYANELDGRRAGSVAEPISTEGQSWIVGVTYEIGAWQFSGSYLQSEVESSVLVSGDDELQAAAGSVSYAWGPGILLAGTLIYAEWDEETSGEQDGISLASGLMLGF